MTPEQRRALDEAIRATNDYTIRQELIRYRDSGQVPTNPGAVNLLNQTAQRLGIPPVVNTGAPSPPAPTAPLAAPRVPGPAPSLAPAGPPQPPQVPQPPTWPGGGGIGSGASSGALAIGDVNLNSRPQPPRPPALVDEFGAQTQGPGGYTSQRPTDPGIAWGAARAAANNLTTPPAPPAGGPPVNPVEPNPGAPVTPPGVDPRAFLANSNLRDNPDDMLLALLNRIGIDLGSPGLYGQQIAKNINSYLPYFHQLLGLQGQGGGPSGDVNNMYSGGLDQLVGMIGNNTLYSGMQDFAGKTRDTLGASLGELKDVEQQKSYLDAVLALSTAGQNPMLRQGAADNAMRSWLGYKTAAINDPVGVGNKGSYVSFLEDQTDPRYNTVLQLLGGGGGR